MKMNKARTYYGQRHTHIHHSRKEILGLLNGVVAVTRHSVAVVLVHGVSKILGLLAHLLALLARGLDTLLMVLQLIAVATAVKGLDLLFCHGCVLQMLKGYLRPDSACLVA